VPATILLLAALAALSGPPVAHGASGEGEGAWRLPLAGPSVAGHFSFDRRRPFAPGQRRVVALAGRPGEPARAPCPGTVSFAGGLPGGRGVSVRCGRLSATLTGLATVAARRGDAVAAGQPVGRLGRDGRLFLGARLRNRPHGYLDPLSLLAPVSGPAPLAPALRPGRPLRPRSRPAPVPRSDFPLAAVLLGAAWLGLGIAGTAVGIGIALGAGGLVRRPAGRARPAGR
jgi:murein DD-endopeptidase MepM/ murein hydrolase activator NlpD